MAQITVVVMAAVIALFGTLLVVVAFLPGNQELPDEIVGSPSAPPGAISGELLYWAWDGQRWELIRLRDRSPLATTERRPTTSAVSPDGSEVALAEGRGEGGGLVRLISLLSDRLRTLDGLPPINSLDWSSDDELWVCDGQGSIRAVSVPQGQVELIAESVRCVGISFSPDRARLAFSTSNSDIVIAPRSDPASGTVVASGVNNGSPSWSPDGTRIAFHSFTGSAASIQILEISSGEVTTAASGSEHALRPTWSPDGGSVAFVRVPRGGAAQVQVVGLATGTVRALDPSPRDQDLPMWEAQLPTEW